MNWITKFIKPKIKSLFKKRSLKSEETLWTDPFNFFFFAHKQTTANVNE